MTGQAHDQLLLRARAHQLFQLFVACRRVEHGVHAGGGAIERRGGGRFADDQVADQQFASVLAAALAHFGQRERAARSVQLVFDAIVRLVQELLLDIVVQLVPGVRLHQARVGRVDQRAQLVGRHVEVALAGRIQIEQQPAGLVQTLETQHSKPGRHWQLHHNLGRQTAGGIGMYFHRALGFQYAGRTGWLRCCTATADFKDGEIILTSGKGASCDRG